MRDPRILGDIPGAARLAVRERVRRARTGGYRELFAFGACAVVLALLCLWVVRTGIPDNSSFLATLSGGATAVTAIVAVVGTVWSAALLLGRVMSFGSADSGEGYLRFGNDPLVRIRRHFRALAKDISHPVVVFVDDLDRCDRQYVVDLLEGIQTVLSDSRVYYVVAADRRWLMRSFKKSYADFDDLLDEPGRSLGYLFLEKAFQLSVSVPRMTKEAQRAYLDCLFRGDEEHLNERWNEMRDAAREEFRESLTQEAIIERLRDGGTDDPLQDQIRREEAVRQSASYRVEVETEYFLRRFAPLLEPNPRSMKRLVNAYGIYRAVAMLTDATLLDTTEKREQFALWTIVSLRWPLFAEYLEKHPDDVEPIRGGSGIEGLPAGLADRSVRAVLNGGPPDGPSVAAPLTAAALRKMILGTKAPDSMSAVVA